MQFQPMQFQPKMVVQVSYCKIIFSLDAKFIASSYYVIKSDSVDTFVESVV